MHTVKCLNRITTLLCGFVLNQVQYNMESAQYLGKSYHIIIIINKYILDIYIQFMEFRLRPLGFLQNNNHHAVKKNEMNWNRKNTVKNHWDFVGIFTYDCKCVSVWVCAYACVGYSCVSMCVCVRVSEGTYTARCFNRI